MPYPLAQLTHFALHRGDYVMTGPTARIVRDQLGYFRHWHMAVVRERFSRREPRLTPTTFIVLSYRRPGNMHALVSGLLALEAAARVIVINNNSEIDLAPYLPRSQRVEIVRGSGAIGYRYVVATQAATDCVAFIDDDLFVMPEAWRQLLRAFEAAPAAPKSLMGALFLPTGNGAAHPSLPAIPIDFGEGSYHWVQIAAPGVVDVVAAGVSVCERRHAKRAIELAASTGVDLGSTSVSDDLYFSFSGTERPSIVGAVPLRDFMFCVTASRKNVAISTNGAEHFYAKRRTFLELERLATFPDDPELARRRAEVILRPVG